MGRRRIHPIKEKSSRGRGRGKSGAPNDGFRQPTNPRGQAAIWSYPLPSPGAGAQPIPRASTPRVARSSSRMVQTGPMRRMMPIDPTRAGMVPFNYQPPQPSFLEQEKLEKSQAHTEIVLRKQESKMAKLNREPVDEDAKEVDNMFEEEDEALTAMKADEARTIKELTLSDGLSKSEDKTNKAWKEKEERNDLALKLEKTQDESFASVIAMKKRRKDHVPIPAESALMSTASYDLHQRDLPHWLFNKNEHGFPQIVKKATSGKQIFMVHRINRLGSQSNIPDSTHEQDWIDLSEERKEKWNTRYEKLKIWQSQQQELGWIILFDEDEMVEGVETNLNLDGE